MDAPRAVFRLDRKARLLEGLAEGRGGAHRARSSRSEGRVRPGSLHHRQLANYLYLAGASMIPTHNTSFALGIAAHAAIDGTEAGAVLQPGDGDARADEPSLCVRGEGRLQRLRTGRLQEEDWSKIARRWAGSARRQLFIDDNPMVTVMDIRAKARRVKASCGDLGLVAVDYLQLMPAAAAPRTARSRSARSAETSRSSPASRNARCSDCHSSHVVSSSAPTSDRCSSDLRESGCLPATRC